MMQPSNGVAASMAALVIVVFGTCGQRPALLRVTEARHRTADALVPFTKASEATNRAVETFEKRDERVDLTLHCLLSAAGLIGRCRRGLDETVALVEFHGAK